MATEKTIEIKGDLILAKSSENYIFVKLGCLKSLDCYRFWDDKMNYQQQEHQPKFRCNRMKKDRSKKE